MLYQNRILRRFALGSSASSCTRSRATRRCSLALGRRQLEGLAERELRARADGAVHARRGQRLHRARRPRAGARADRLPLRLEPRNRQRQLPLRPASATTTGGRPSSAAGASTGGSVQPLPRAPGARALLRREALELLHPDAAERATRRALERIYREDRGASGAGGDPPAPGAVHRPAHGEAAGRLQRGPASHARTADRHALVGLARRRGPGSGSSTRRTSRAGTTSAGSTPPRSARAGRWRTRRSRSRRRRRARRRRSRRGREARRERAYRTLGNPAVRPQSRSAVTKFATAALRDADSDWKKEEYPLLVMNAPPAHRRVPRLPGRLMACLRAQQHPLGADAPRRRRRRPRPALDRARDAGAGRHRARPATLPVSRALGLALAVYGGAALRPARARGGDRSRPAAAGTKVLVSVFLDGGADSLSMLFPADDAHYRKLRPRLALTPDATSVQFTEDPRLWWHPRSRRSRRCTPRARSPSCRASATRTRTSRTSPRVTTGRSARRRAPRHRLDGPLPRPLRHATTTRSRGSRSTGASSRRSRRRRARRVGRRARPLRLLDARRLGLGRGSGWSRRSARSAICRARATPGSTRRTPAARQSAPPPAAAPFRRGRERGFGSPVAVSASRRLVPAAARGARGDARRRPPAPLRRDHGTRRLRHARRPAAGPRRRARADRRDAARVPARPRGARARRSRARPRLVGVRPPPEENGSAGTDHGAAGVGFVIGTRASGHMVGEFPDLVAARPRRQPPPDLRLPLALPHAHRGLARRRRRGDHPGCKLPRPKVLK